MSVADVIRDRLPGVVVYDTDATGAQSFPYLLVLSTPGDQSWEAPFACDESQDTVIVRAVGVNVDQARNLLWHARKRLTNLTVEADGSLWQFRFDGSPRQPQVDRQVTVKSTNTSPVFVDDEYEVFRQYWRTK